MHEVFKIKSSKNNPKFQQKLNNFENPQKFSKTPNGVSKHEMHEYERLEAYQVKKDLKKLEETLRKKIGVSERG